MGENRKTNVEPGKQTLQTMEHPVSTSLWRGKIADLSVVADVDPDRTETLSYWLFVPTSESAKSETGYPLLLFLHGAGERGDDPNKVKVHGPPKLIEKDGEHWSFITVSPQCPDGQYWSPKILLQLIDKIESEYFVDKNRIYVTGLSMGGFGTWMLLATAPERIAAAAPVCGGGDVDSASLMVDIPIWAFHGEDDFIVVPALSKKMVEAIRQAGGEKVQLSLYPGVGHNSWDNAYDSPELWKWFLQQSK